MPINKFWSSMTLPPNAICTTKNQETDKVWGMRQGARAYVTKPVDGPALLAMIAALG